MIANFQMCGIMLALRAVFNMLVRNANPRGTMCIRCQNPVRCNFLLFLLALGPELW